MRKTVTKQLRKEARRLMNQDDGYIRLPSGAIRHAKGTYTRIYSDLKKQHRRGK